MLFPVLAAREKEGLLFSLFRLPATHSTGQICTGRLL